MQDWSESSNATGSGTGGSRRRTPRKALDSDSTHLIVNAQSSVWRRRLGPLAWAALEDLALAAHHTEQGWVAPVGVRDIASRVGVTKDTAARAVAVLGAAGLVVLQRVPHQTASGVPATGSNSPTVLSCEPARTIQTPPHPTPTTPVPIGKTAAVPQAKTAATTVQTAKTPHSPTSDHGDGCPTRPDSPAPAEAVPPAHRCSAGGDQHVVLRSCTSPPAGEPPSSRRYSIWPPATTSLHFTPLPERTRTLVV